MKGDIAAISRDSKLLFEVFKEGLAIPFVICFVQIVQASLYRIEHNITIGHLENFIRYWQRYVRQPV